MKGVSATIKNFLQKSENEVCMGYEVWGMGLVKASRFAKKQVMVYRSRVMRQEVWEPKRFM